MKTYVLILISLFTSFKVFAQSDLLKIDSLSKVLLAQKDDTDKVNTLNALSWELCNEYKIDSSIQYSNKALSLAATINFKKGIAKAYEHLGFVYTQKKDYGEAVKNFTTAQSFYEQINDKHDVATIYQKIALMYNEENVPAKVFQNLFSELTVYQQLHDTSGIADTYTDIEGAYFDQDNYPEAIKYQYLALNIYEELHDKKNIGASYQYIAAVNNVMGNDSVTLANLFLALKVRKEVGDKWAIAQTSISTGDYYFKKKNYSQAKQYHTDGLEIFKQLGGHAPSWGLPFGYTGVAKDYDLEGKTEYQAGDIALANEKFREALDYNVSALQIWRKTKNSGGEADNLTMIGNLYIELKNNDSAKYYLEKALQLGKDLDMKSNLRDTYAGLLVLDSVHGNYHQAFEDYKMFILYRDSVVNEEAAKKILQTQMQYDFDKKETVNKAVQDKKDADAKRIKNQQYFAIAGLGIVVLAVIIIALIQFRNNKQKQKANLLLERQKQKVESTLTELKSTQAQLIQSEKMASLGELTAGIAHEIQNPLNFVNNFSEVNQELISELVEEVDNGNTEEVKAIALDIKDNEEKINHHGKRADSIVKGMLQHSRQTKGVKEPTDVNALCDEYLRLSYHGLRAKDKNFNADFKTDFDETIGKINIVPQDIGRVLLNLFNNAFYAVNEKKKLMANDYHPMAEVKTRRINDKVEITVSDNGNGIPENLTDKIFQPYFTTKPTGQGTGLGLSLAYDIITKEHSGTIKVESKEDNGSKFIIMLPS